MDTKWLNDLEASLEPGDERAGRYVPHVRVGLVYVPSNVDKRTCAALCAIVRGKAK